MKNWLLPFLFIRLTWKTTDMRITYTILYFGLILILIMFADYNRIDSSLKDRFNFVTPHRF